MSRPRRGLEPVATFDIELYWPGVTVDTASALAEGIRAVAAAMTADGKPVRFVSAALTPMDEVCFVRLRGSRAHSEEAALRAGVVDPRISEVVVVSATRR